MDLLWSSTVAENQKKKYPSDTSGAPQVMLMAKNSPANAGDVRDTDAIPGSVSPYRRKWQPTPVFLPGKIPWTEEPGGLQSVGSPRVGSDRARTHPADTSRPRWEPSPAQPCMWSLPARTGNPIWYQASKSDSSFARASGPGRRIYHQNPDSESAPGK